MTPAKAHVRNIPYMGNHSIFVVASPLGSSASPKGGSLFPAQKHLVVRRLESFVFKFPGEYPYLCIALLFVIKLTLNLMVFVPVNMTDFIQLNLP